MRQLILYLAALSLGCPAFSQSQSGAAESIPLLLVQEIPLPHVEGRIDHFTFDAERKRVIGAALGNNAVEVVDTFAGRDVHASRAQRTRKEWPLRANSTNSSSQMALMESCEFTTANLSHF